LRATQSVPAIFDYESFALSYVPRPDGVVLPDSPDALARDGKFASIPYIIGDQEDEGTLFSLSTSNISTTEQLEDYLATYYFHDATNEQIQQLVANYPEDQSAGSPYNTGVLNEIYPQFKRIASLLGDIVFILTRRVFLDCSANAYPDVPFWSYLAPYDYGTPILGTFHASDILTTYGITAGVPSSSIQGYYIRFFNTLDPNDGTKGLLNWPQWKENKELLHFLALSNELTTDDFRNEIYAFISNSA
jgi:carboxylesterase type B